MSENPSAPASADVVIVGAGPAGLMAALAAAEHGAETALCEQLPAPGRKLLATGGGRCNLTIDLPEERIASAFGRQGRFLQPALEAMGPRRLREVLDRIGVATAAPDGLHVFPVSESSAAVLSALVEKCRDLGVSLRTDCRVTALLLRDGVLAGVETLQGPLAARRVVLATGGRSYSRLGATGSGYELAGSVGHRLTEPTPALVPLVTRETWPARLAGVSLPNVEVRLDSPGRGRRGLAGPVLFTHRGVSGPAVLDLSGDVAVLLARKKKPVRMLLNLTPGVPAAAWLGRLDAWHHTRGRKSLAALLAEHLPASLAGMLCRLAALPGEGRSAHATAEQHRRLASLLTALPLTVVDTEGWEAAMVTRGGVPLKEVSPATLQSRLVAGLYLAGEVLDLDGPCGGYNLQWAFASGHLAGASAARSL